MRRRELGTSVLLVALMAGMLTAADNSDPTGTWKWIFINKENNNEEVELKVKLKYESGSLSGKFVNAAKKEIAIEDASFKDGEVVFTVTQERTPTTNYVSKFKGKLNGDTLKGTGEVKAPRSTKSFDWDATREKE